MRELNLVNKGWIIYLDDLGGGEGEMGSVGEGDVFTSVMPGKHHTWKE